MVNNSFSEREKLKIVHWFLQHLSKEQYLLGPEAFLTKVIHGFSKQNIILILSANFEYLPVTDLQIEGFLVVIFRFVLVRDMSY